MKFEMPTKDGIAKWRWQFATQRLRDAYDAARSSLDATLRNLERENDKWRADKPDPTDPDEIDSYENWGDNIADRHGEAAQALQTVRQGFAVILYHSWERHAVDWTSWKGKYKHGVATGHLLRGGYLIEPSVHKLNKVANCLKHDSAELWKQDRSMFKDVVAQVLKLGGTPEYARNLELSEQHMTEFFDALMASGPPGPASISL